MSKSDRIVHKTCVPASIVYIMLPILCLVLLFFRWQGIWLTKPWMAGVYVSYYTLAVAYLIFTIIIRMRVIEIIGFFVILVLNPVIRIPFSWVIEILLLPALFMIFYKRRNKIAAIVLSSIMSVILLMVFLLAMTIHSLNPSRYAYHMSSNGQYAALEHSFILFPSGTDVILCRFKGPLLIKERTLYLANYSDLGGEIEWIDDSNVFIYDQTMNVFTDPIIKNYDPF